MNPQRRNRRLLASCGAALALTGCGPFGDTDSGAEDAPIPVAEAAVGDCTARDVPDDPEDFAVDCGSADAFWTITAIEDPDLIAVGGTLPDAEVFAFCGESIGAQVPGRAWTDWGMVADAVSGEVKSLFCLEAVGRPTAAGADPTAPSEGECLDPADDILGTYPCDSPEAAFTVSSVVAIDESEWGTADTAALASACGGHAHEAVDRFGRTTAVYCLE
ncbi:hypothetical protein [Glycomyces paridis]|uniref:Septum formation-related domain-containing protein n=1 Tax=Glycomyces paridis TaxID=2126555 RepID=A0A4S8PB88_9ACTN|nr:hypothetical protein [Glycomyces paridis]THV27550.1 hypothetical protein E9998_14145 [Glycomyces paridis]